MATLIKGPCYFYELYTQCSRLQMSHVCQVDGDKDPKWQGRPLFGGQTITNSCKWEPKQQCPYVTNYEKANSGQIQPRLYTTLAQMLLVMWGYFCSALSDKPIWTSEGRLRRNTIIFIHLWFMARQLRASDLEFLSSYHSIFELGKRRFVSLSCSVLDLKDEWRRSSFSDYDDDDDDFPTYFNLSRQLKRTPGLEEQESIPMFIISPPYIVYSTSQEYGYHYPDRK